MRIPRIYQAVPLKVNDLIMLDAQAATHVVRALRLKPNDRLIVFNGEGGEFSGVLVQVDKREVTVKLLEYFTSNNESPLYITLLQGVSRGERMDFTLQKAVELGVNEIYPVMTKHTSVQLKEERKSKKQNHWQCVVNSACEQSGRNKIPVVRNVTSISESLDKVVTENYDNYFVLNHRSTQSFSSLESNNPSRVVLVAGPEGGFSEDEVDDMERRGFTSVSLGPRVLRTETAALAAVAVLQSMWGDFS